MSTPVTVEPPPTNNMTAPAVSGKSRGWIRKLIMTVLLAGAVAWGARFVHHILTHVETEDAYVTGSIHTISARIAGVVDEVLVVENTAVQKGQPIIRLETQDLKLRLDEAEAALQQAKAGVTQSEAKLQETLAQNDLTQAGIDLAKANVVRDEANARKAQADFDRAKELFAQGKGGVITQADFDTAQTGLETANATLAATRAACEAAKAYFGTAEAREAAARAELEAAKAQLRSAEARVRDANLQLSYATVVAPCDGLVSRKAVEVGNRIQPGQAVFALVESKVWIQANFKETQLDGLRVGAPVEIRIDALPGKVFEGRIESLSPASGAQFALLPPDNATGNFTKVVQRVPVKVVFDPASIRGMESQIRPGLSTVVSIAL